MQKFMICSTHGLPATQSATGTYDNEVGPRQPPKEATPFKTEINRIADSANFNGIKLMDGFPSPP